MNKDRSNMSAGVRPAGQTFYGVQALRAVAATLVVVSHIGNFLNAKCNIDVQDYTIVGRSGVDIFFVISGFIMMYSTNTRINPGDFLVRRFIRIAPLYWIFTIAFLLGSVLTKYQTHNYGFGWVGYASAALFLPFRNADGEIYPPISQGWTLNYEMFFYVALALLTWLFRRNRLAALVTLFSLLSFGRLIEFHDAYWETYTDPITLEFVFGCIIAELGMKRASRVSRPVLFGLAFSAIIAICVATPFRDGGISRAFYWGLPSAALVFSFVGFEGRIDFRRQRFFQLIGDSSYSLYLAHGLILSTLFSLSLVRSLGLAALPILTTICWLAGHVCHVYVELPVTRLARGLLTPRSLMRPRSRSAKPFRGAREDHI